MRGVDVVDKGASWAVERRRMSELWTARDQRLMRSSIARAREFRTPADDASDRCHHRCRADESQCASRVRDHVLGRTRERTDEPE